MRKYIPTILAGLGLVSGCASQGQVRFGEYSMSSKGFDEIVEVGGKESTYKEIIHFCERNDLDRNKILSESEIKTGLAKIILKIGN